MPSARAHQIRSKVKLTREKQVFMSNIVNKFVHNSLCNVFETEVYSMVRDRPIFKSSLRRFV